MAAPPAANPAPDPAARVTIDAASSLGPLEIDRFALGQGGLSHYPMIDSHVESIRWLKPRVIRLFVQEYFNVYPERGVYDWTRLDRAVEAILATGAAPLMCICIKPPPLYPDVRDQDRPEPSDYAEWEELIYRMVRRYNHELQCGIRYWEVFNEPDIGEEGGCPCRFTPEAYASYYEHTAAAVRRADPSAKVGGPALAASDSPILPALLERCAAHSLPLDFVSWHYYTSDPGFMVKTIEYVKALLTRFPSLRPELVVDEWNMSLGWETVSSTFQPCFILEATKRMLDAGVDLACYYHIRDWHVCRTEFAPFMSDAGASFMAWWWNINPQYHGLWDFQGHLRPAYFSMRMLSLLTGQRLRLDCSRGNVSALATWDSVYNAAIVVVWNFALDPPPPAPVEIRIENLPGSRWEYRRRELDSATAGNGEGDRLRLVENRRFDGAVLEDAFSLPSYGAAILLLRRLG